MIPSAAKSTQPKAIASTTSIASILQTMVIPPHPLRRNSQGIRKLSEIADFRELLVRVEGLEPPTWWSQTTRATNCATPGYEVEVLLRLWSVMWSLLIFRPFLPSARIPQVQALQGFPAFRSVPPRIQARHSQTACAANYAVPGYATVKYQLRYYTTSSTSVQEQNSMERRFAAPCYFLFNSAQSRTMTEMPFGMTVRLCLPILCVSSSAASSDGA